MSEVRRQVALPPRPNWGWQDAAACRGKEVVLFFGPDGERQPEREIRERKAKAVCAACPVRADLRGLPAREVRYLGWAQRGRARFGAAPPDAPGERGLIRRWSARHAARSTTRDAPVARGVTASICRPRRHRNPV